MKEEEKQQKLQKKIEKEKTACLNKLATTNSTSCSTSFSTCSSMSPLLEVKEELSSPTVSPPLQMRSDAPGFRQTSVICRPGQPSHRPTDRLIDRPTDWRKEIKPEPGDVYMGVVGEPGLYTSSGALPLKNPSPPGSYSPYRQSSPPQGFQQPSLPMGYNLQLSPRAFQPAQGIMGYHQPSLPQGYQPRPKQFNDQPQLTLSPHKSYGIPSTFSPHSPQRHLSQWHYSQPQRAFSYTSHHYPAPPHISQHFPPLLQSPEDRYYRNMEHTESRAYGEQRGHRDPREHRDQREHREHREQREHREHREKIDHLASSPLPALTPLSASLSSSSPIPSAVKRGSVICQGRDFSR